jgi:hypothetical protein
MNRVIDFLVTATAVYHQPMEKDMREKEPKGKVNRG